MFCNGLRLSTSNKENDDDDDDELQPLQVFLYYLN